MEAESSRTSTTNPPRTNFQSIEDFMKEQDELDTQKASGAIINLDTNLSKEQKRASLQVERERLGVEKKLKKEAADAEKRFVEEQANEAVNGLGVENWVGKLLGRSSLTNYLSRIQRLTKIQNIATHILHQLEG